MGIHCKNCGRHGHDASVCRPVYNGPSLREMDEQRKSGHFPGCHKVHIECANKKIGEARKLFKTCPDTWEWPGDVDKWLESLGEK